MATDNEILIAKKGTFVLNNTTEKTVNVNAIVVLEDTLFSSIKIAAPATAVKAGTIIRATAAQQFSGLKLLSGSALLILA
jgi:hypothetical protein